MHFGGRPSRSHSQRAFTLVEMLLVLAILVVVAAVVLPSFYRSLRDSTLRSAAEQVRTEWNRAHIKAMKSGRIQVFRFQPGGRKFQIEPYQAADDELNGVGGVNTFAPPPVPQGNENEESGTQLPEGITFLEGMTAEEERAKAVEEAMGMGGGGGDWSKPILFYPDGVSSDAWLVVADQHNSAIRVELRGLTGLAVLGDLTTPEEAQGASE
ncbi:MAG: prepilin-type N-terminal cleavage/methylation domain-containing protein [Pirellulaceae bacterium]